MPNKNQERKNYCRVALSLLIVAMVFGSQKISAQDNTVDNTVQISEKEEELKTIQEKIQTLNAARAKKEQEKNSLNRTIEIINDNILATRLELEKTVVSIDLTNVGLEENLKQTQNAEKQIEKLKSELQDILREMSVYETKPLWQSVFGKGSFSDYLQAAGAYRSLEKRMMSTMYVTEDAKKVLETQKEDLQKKQDELAQLQEMQGAQKRSLQGEEVKKKEVLSMTVAQQKKITGLIAEAEDARQEVQRQIFSLRSAGISMSLTDALEMAQYAGKVTGVRPALLLGVLKVESNLGNNVGSGRYPDDVHPAHRDAFLRVVKKLGLDPEKAPVSAKPKSYSGWGGAMGPGQIMPGIWESIESEISNLTGNSLPSPYSLQDAFVGTAVILRNSGAAAGNEYQAVNRYFAGGNWQRFTWYGDRVLAVAKEYE